MGPRALALAVLVLAAVCLILVARKDDASRTALPRGRPAEGVVSNGRVGGVVRKADGTPAAGAAVFLDLWFMPLGAQDVGLADTTRTAIQNEEGVWEWLPAPTEPPRQEPLRTTTDGDGRFVFEESPELEELVAEDRVKVWAELDGEVTPHTLVRVASESVRLPPLMLGPALRPRIRVLTPGGAPVVDAFVELTVGVEQAEHASHDDRLALYYVTGAKTDDRGLATLPAVPDRPDWNVWIHINPHEMPRHRSQDVTLAALRATEPLRLKISRGFTLRGRVVLPDGTPGKGVHIASRQERWDPNPNAGHATETAEDGTFELRGVPTRDAVVEFIQAPWLQPGPAEPAAFMRFPAEGAGARLTMRMTGVAGDIRDLGTVRLLPTLSIRGTVLGPDGKPAGNGHVSLGAPGGSYDLRADGSFEIGSLEPGRHAITATVYEEGEAMWDRPLEATVTDVAAGAEDVVIHVTGGGNLVVRFHPVGRPDEPLEVHGPGITWGSGSKSSSRKAAEVRTTLEPGRRSDLRVEAEGYETRFLGPVVIHADRKTVVDVALEPEG